MWAFSHIGYMDGMWIHFTDISNISIEQNQRTRHDTRVSLTKPLTTTLKTVSVTILRPLAPDNIMVNFRHTDR